ncbi:MAG: chemotaxis protein CheW [Bdellovibrionota bacterium]
MAETCKLIGFKLAEEEFSVEIGRVKEIVQVPLITRVSKAPDFVEGITNLRGDILQIINFHKIMGLENIPMTDKSRIIVIDDKNVLAAIIVDLVTEVMEIEKNSVQITPDIIAADKAKFLKGIIKPDTRRNILWLDLDAIYSEFKNQSSKKTTVI